MGPVYVISDTHIYVLKDWSTSRTSTYSLENYDLGSLLFNIDLQLNEYWSADTLFYIHMYIYYTSSVKKIVRNKRNVSVSNWQTLSTKYNYYLFMGHKQWKRLMVTLLLERVHICTLKNRSKGTSTKLYKSYETGITTKTIVTRERKKVRI